MTTFFESIPEPLRLLAGLLLIALGLVALVRNIRGFRHLPEDSTREIRALVHLVRGFRGSMLALLGIVPGFLGNAPMAAGLALVIALEELYETTMLLGLLRWAERAEREELPINPMFGVR